MPYVAEERKQSSLGEFRGKLTKEEIESIGAVAMNRWNPFIASVEAHL